MSHDYSTGVANTLPCVPDPDMVQSRLVSFNHDLFFDLSLVPVLFFVQHFDISNEHELVFVALEMIFDC